MGSPRRCDGIACPHAERRAAPPIPSKNRRLDMPSRCAARANRAIELCAYPSCIFVCTWYAFFVDWDDLRFFLQVARHRTLSGAARDLKVTQPTVGRRIAGLERRLGAKLFVRRPDGFELSTAGAHVIEFAERMEQDSLGAERRVSGRDEGLTGTVRVTASEWIISNVLPQLIGPLLTRHPGLALELIADQRHLNLVRREADLALRPRPFEHDAIVQRATAKVSFALYAARAYLAKRDAPTSGQGRGHVLIAMTDDVGDVARTWLKTVLPEAALSVRTNGRDAMISLASAGIGVACLARIVGDRFPTLQRVRMSPEGPTVKLWLGMHRDLQGTPRVREVASYLTHQLRALQPKLCPRD